MGVLKLAQFVPTVLIGLVMVSAHQQSVKPVCTCAPREVGQSGTRNDWEGYRKAGIAWHYSVDEAMKIAQAEKKLVFWYHVAGDLDKEGC